MLIKGFRFGMLLQLAVGPMCLFIFQCSMVHGFTAGEMGVLGTALVDSTEILLAILGLSVILEKSKKAQLLLKIFGIAVLVLYGLFTIYQAFSLTGEPQAHAAVSGSLGSIVAQAVVLALSDPLTIVFWAGIFAAKITQEHFSVWDLRLFACGCVLATLFFLSLVSLAGSVSGQLIPVPLIRALNFGVGLLLLYFAYQHYKR